MVILKATSLLKGHEIFVELLGTHYFCDTNIFLSSNSKGNKSFLPNWIKQICSNPIYKIIICEWSTWFFNSINEVERDPIKKVWFLHAKEHLTIL
jgi:hypothetical protein